MKIRGLRGAAGACAVAAIVFLLARSLWAMACLWLFGGYMADPATPDAAVAALETAVSVLAMVTPLLFCLKATYLTWGDLRLAEPAPWSPWFCILLFLGAMNATSLFFGLFAKMAGVDDGISFELGSGAALAIRFVGVCVVPAICEELLFRGAMQSLLRPSGSAVAIFGPALLFGLLHESFAQRMAAIVGGMVLGWLAERTGSILPGMAVHFVNNSLGFAALWLMENVSPQASGVFGALVTVGTPVAAAWAIWRARSQGFRFSDGLRGGAEAWEVLKSPAYVVGVAFLVLLAMGGLA